ncbi:MAG: TetR family transcriptional regulator [Candidatus Marinimicrobia bacterium]|nr:TetR family transcriptional regulator [Candidatus Neomarinimicrobiota bacterium]
MANKREDIIETTCALLESQGYHATGLNQILKESGAPKGSLYYYFPEGKEELAEEAIRRTAERVERNIRAQLAGYEDYVEAITSFIRTIASYVTEYEFKAGGPLTTLALESANTSERLTKACDRAYSSWCRAFSDILEQNGYPPARAASLAHLIISVIEGATVLSRTERSTQPIEDAAEEIARLLKC